MSEKKLTPAYFVPVLLFSLIVPNLILYTAISINLVVIALLCYYAAPIINFAVMRLWGRYMTQKPYAPQILIWKYFPVLIPSLWHILTGVVFVLTDPKFAETGWGAAAALDISGFIGVRILGFPVVITRVIQDLSVISGFVVGERAVARDLGLIQPFGIKPAAIIAAGALGVILFGAFMVR